MKKEITDFLCYLKDVKESSHNTILSYQGDLNKLATFLEGYEMKTWDKLNETILNSYILYLEKGGLSPASVSRNIATIRTFLLFLFKQGKIKQDPAERIRAPKVDKKAPEILTVENIEHLMEQPDITSHKGLRDKAMLELLYATGIKVSELIHLQLSDLNLNHNFICCNTNGKERLIPFGKQAKVAISNYLEKARDCLIEQKVSSYLFTNYQGEPMSRQGFWKLIKKYAKMAGIEKDITPQTLRHSFAAHLIKNGANLRAVSDMLGYSDVSATQIYLSTGNVKVKEAYSVHPRA